VPQTVTGTSLSIVFAGFTRKPTISGSFLLYIFDIGLYIGYGASYPAGNGHIQYFPKKRFLLESSWIFPATFPQFPGGYNRKVSRKIR
jgi:hypothetical protein